MHTFKLILLNILYIEIAIMDYSINNSVVFSEFVVRGGVWKYIANTKYPYVNY